MREDLSRRLLATFVGELDDQVRDLNAALLELEAGTGDAESIRGLFRSAHTVKGAARVAGVTVIEAACHEMESLFAAVRDGRRSLDGADFALLFATADALSEAGRRLRAGEPLEDSSLASLLPRIQAAAGEAARGPSEAPGTGVGPAPSPAETEPAAGPPSGARDDAVRVPASRLDDLLSATGDLRTLAGRARSRVQQWEGAVAAHRRALGPVVDGGNGEPEALLRELDRLADGLRSDARALGRITTDLAHAVQATRLRRFGETTDGLPRAVRDIATASGKEIELVVEGEELEADRIVIDALGGPLLHLVRNAADHGIEPPSERRRAGKPALGRVRVTARHLRGRFVVEVADDGAGLDEKALRASLSAGGQPAPARREDLVAALLAGGLTTRREASPFSGRGVGLELVRTALQRIGGSVDVAWEAGRGTTITLDAPPSPAAIRALLVRLGAHLFALPVEQAQRVLLVRAADLRLAGGRRVLPTRDGPIPVQHLARVLGPPLAEPPLTDPAQAVVLVAGQRRAALLVDELVAEEEVYVRPLVEPAHIGVAAGATILATGAVALVLNPGVLVARAHAAPAAPTAREPGPRARILVVDDSITTRTLERGVLEAAGYRVETDPDGQAAWDRLASEPVDLVVADVDMPRMDGMELTRRIRADARLASTPVVLVTALASDEDRRRGLDAGADAYVVKSSFDQATLIDIVRQLLDEP